MYECTLKLHQTQNVKIKNGNGKCTNQKLRFLKNGWNFTSGLDYD
jgi:hypothetical protein